ncbi:MULTISPECIES: hypothetical protein [Mycolicibacterium]|uniref:Uncharacterized protein n=1 Tax=Mycobacterium phage Bipper TaxID=1805457 RepID=A0A142F2G7_9CAUD|nr:MULTISPECIES: hypothetical protein [Mycolicibacterium]YP_009303186.1 hypothetical protein KCH39_gp038 [Mycobacterium phage Bipper]QDF19325.1 hypothetical protein SEA_CRACKLEWINK_38 [Mycobacterium phage Cracklewink]AMQ66974.1 hypothetical protein SEA_BIPPER_38 [Mycobacterium phage Bipper]MCC9181058.1 hypothetical protein [Mycolicibacterium mageritense]UBV14778.1 hypothetical protein H8Z57_29455 [Mycolicibacterium fortuitum]
MANRLIAGYPRGQLETMIRLQRRTLLLERADLTHTVNDASRRLGQVTEELAELDRAEQLLHDM